MKRFLACLCAVMLLSVGAACADTVTVYVWTDPDATPVEMEMYQSDDLGVSMPYAPEHFTPSADTNDKICFNDYESAFIVFSSITDMTKKEIADGLVLQAGQDDLAADDGAYIGDDDDEKALEATSVIYMEDNEGEQYIHSFFLVEREKDVLMVEIYYPLEMKDPMVGMELTSMIQSIALN